MQNEKRRGLEECVLACTSLSGSFLLFFPKLTIAEEVRGDAGKQVVNISKIPLLAYDMRQMPDPSWHHEYV